jgi:hypothetical protein
MRDDRRDSFVEELLEASLKQYHSEEPRSGLELRVLAGVRSRERAAGRRTLGWAVAVCSAMLAALVLALHFIRAPLRQPAPNAARLQESGAHRAPLQGATPPAMVSQQQPRGSGGLGQGLKDKPGPPKPEVLAARRPEQFPTPYPITEQEKLLLVYLDKATEPDSAAGTNQIGVAPVGDLEIPGIKIAALEIKALDDSQSKQQK